MGYSPWVVSRELDLTERLTDTHTHTHTHTLSLSLTSTLLSQRLHEDGVQPGCPMTLVLIRALPSLAL